MPAPISEVSFRVSGASLYTRTPYVDGFSARVRAAGLRARWQANTREWRFDAAERDRVLAFLASVYPGVTPREDAADLRVSALDGLRYALEQCERAGVPMADVMAEATAAFRPAARPAYHPQPRARAPRPATPAAALLDDVVANGLTPAVGFGSTGSPPPLSPPAPVVAVESEDDADQAPQITDATPPEPVTSWRL